MFAYDRMVESNEDSSVIYLLIICHIAVRTKELYQVATSHQSTSSLRRGRFGLVVDRKRGNGYAMMKQPDSIGHVNYPFATKSLEK